MQLTIDSAQPLEDVLRVVGALYNVTLQVGAAQPAEPAPAAEAPARGRARAAAVRRAGGGRTRRTRAARGSSTAAIRAWAQENGLEVGDRGRIPAGVVTAYRQAHGG